MLTCLLGPGPGFRDNLDADNAVLQQEIISQSEQQLENYSVLASSMAEIATQNQQLAHLIVEQSDAISSIHNFAEQIGENVDGGNRELDEAVSHDSASFRNTVVLLLLGASMCLLFLDYVS
jgi:t-SNARE complex subunit (syntaxin)